jgi:tRNA threonylcarbamoyladenosine dehydratase
VSARAVEVIPDLEDINSPAAALALTPAEFYDILTTFYDILTTRNTGVVRARDQQRVAEAKVLVAGCGSIGGAAIEPLVRFGFRHLVLADPGAYELNNLNRQNATVADLGRNKAEVAAARAQSINPHAEIEVVSDGVTAATLEHLLDGVTLIVDGVDITTRRGLTAKGLLHEAAGEAQLPLFTGWDMSGTQYLRLYDYRRGGPVFDGQVSRSEMERLPMWDLLARLVPARKVPRDLLRLVRIGLGGETFTFPQLVHAADQFGVLATSMAYRIVTGRPVPRHVTVDVHAMTMPRPMRLAESLLQPLEAGLLLRSIFFTKNSR